MRTSFATLASFLLVSGSSSFAQQVAVRAEASPFSPFVYEALGATPTIRLNRATAVAAEQPAAADAERAQAKPAVRASAELAAAPDTGAASEPKR